MQHYFRRQAETAVVTAFAHGDVNGDSITDYVYLTGYQSTDSPYVTGITLIIQDGRTQQFYSIPLITNTGYQPRLFLGDFTGNGIDNILISMDSGGSGGFGYYYVYAFLNNQPSLLFNYETFDSLFTYTVTYQNDYKVNVTNETLALSFIIDLSNRSEDYLSEIYADDGTLLTPIQGSVSGLNQLYPVDFNGDGVYELFAFQRVIGRYNADGLGLIQTPLSWNGQQFTPFSNQQYLAVSGQSSE
ncbi:VCBS repeat-containing protein [Halobacillus kuroshimensis]|uniref:VCBS repeat-containing protein n=1 Tax=Halobacillus kuroshimensis TaxID=302481 RepID=A0ABS3DX38_9BACI|nr:MULTISPECIES: VCBS repeat-containing protein [Halobacillus]MBN8235885.1 VCBS repeat-containing protein [Halobacillus kuroshimensis]